MIDAFEEPYATMPSRRELMDRLDRLAIPADAKALLAQLCAAAVRVGDAVVEAGRRILHFAFEALKTFPGATVGVVVGATLSMLIGSVPLLGAVLGPLLGPLLVAFGLGMGAISDVRDGQFRARLRNLVTEFQELLGT